MPAKSKKQQRFMAAVANNPKFAKKVGVPKSVGEEFMKKGYMGGGMMRRYAGGGKLKMVEKDGQKVPFYAADGKGKMMAGGKVKKYQRGGMMDGMDSPGMGVSEEDIRALQGPQDAPAGFRPMVSDDEMEGKKKVPMPPKRKKKAPAKKKMASGGKVRGCGMARGGAVRPCKMVKMKGS